MERARLAVVYNVLFNIIQIIRSNKTEVSPTFFQSSEFSEQDYLSEDRRLRNAGERRYRYY